jgi:adenosyl cobinamide kinase/adenosyl cobinamide phosphate guanylyltransferase
MAERAKTSRRAAGETRQNYSKTALAMAKRAARSELRRIFDEEMTQRISEHQHSRPATAAHHS